MDEIWRKCLISNKEFDTARGFLNHLRYLGTNSKDYYDKYHKKEGEGICCCGNKTNYHGFEYKRFCSRKCGNSSEGHREKVSKRFINNPDALISFTASRKNADINLEKRRNTIREKAKQLGMTEYEYYCSQSRFVNSTHEERLEYSLKAMETKDRLKSGLRYKAYNLFDDIVSIQGYENIILDYLIQDLYLKKGQILVSKKYVPYIRYEFNGKNRLYFPDIYLPKHNLLIEVKSDFTYSCHKENVDAKSASCIKNGYSILVIKLNKKEGRKAKLEDGSKNLLHWAISSQASNPTQICWYGEGSSTIPQGSRE